MSVASSRTVRFHDYGEPLDVLVLERAEVPEPGPAQVRVRVAATGLNPADWEVCRGFMAGSLPRGIGFDVAGTVDAVGEGVTAVSIGDEVFGTADVLGRASGGVADMAILRAWAARPEGLAAPAAATLPMVVTTAGWTLGALGAGPGETVVIHGAGAMVGFAAVQMALELGARVIATAGPTHAADLEAFGAAVIPYGEGMASRVRAIAGGPVDLVLDTAPTTPGTIARLLDLVDDPSSLVTISNHAEARPAGARVNLDLLADATALTDPAVLFERYGAQMAAGSFRLPIARVFPLEQWPEAVRLSMSRNPHGKVVIAP